MHKKFITPAYLINIIAQALFGLLLPIGASLLLSWALVTYLSVGGFIYAILVPLGAVFGLYTMISFIVRASAALETVERQRREAEKKAQAEKYAKENIEKLKESDCENE